MPLLCPVCGLLGYGVCKCMNGEAKCENGHIWHRCVLHRNLVEGAFNHKIKDCLCSERKTWPMPIEQPAAPEQAPPSSVQETAAAQHKPSVVFLPESHVPFTDAVRHIYNESVGHGNELSFLSRRQLEEKLLSSDDLSEEQLRYLLQNGGVVLRDEDKMPAGVQSHVTCMARNIAYSLRACQEAVANLHESIAEFRKGMTVDQMKADTELREQRERFAKQQELDRAKQAAQKAANAKRAATRAANEAAKKAKH